MKKLQLQDQEYVHAARKGDDGGRDDKSCGCGMERPGGWSPASERPGSSRDPGGSKGDRVICTHFMRKGQLDAELWRADMAFTRQHLPAAMVRGYHVWAIPYVRLMRRSPLAEKLMLPLAVWRAEEIAFRMGLREKGNWKGKLLRWAGEPACWVIGKFTPDQDWEALWRDNGIRHV